MNQETGLDDTAASFPSCVSICTFSRPNSFL